MTPYEQTNMTAYIEQANGRWESWTYTDPMRRYNLGSSYDLASLRRRLLREGYRVVMV